MKYLKRFNEELKPETYLKASAGLIKYHPERANRLIRHVLNDDYRKFGPLNLIMGVGGYSKMNTPAATVKIGQYNITAMDFGLDITQDNFPVKDLYFHVFFQNLANSDDRKVLNIIVPYVDGTFKKAHISFWDADDIVLFADRASALKFKKALQHFVYQSKSFYNEFEHFSFRETLYRQLDDLSHDSAMEFNFDDLAFNDLLKSITLDHLSLNKLFSTSTDRFQLPTTIE